MTLDAVYGPVRAEIAGVKQALNGLVGSFDFPATEAVVEHFSRMPGKFLRPALLLLSAKALVPDPDQDLTDRLVRTGAGVELIHDASLIHDDILDHDVERRGQPTLNAVWGTKIALLAGDVLYSRAFGTLTETLSLPLLQRVVRLNETMCSAEIEQAQAEGRVLSREEYFRIIEGKTAAFMSLCCRLGAALAGGNEAEVAALSSFGLAFGLAFQLFDDQADGDLGCPDVDCGNEGQEHCRLAVASLEALAPTRARDKLLELVGHLVLVSRARS